MLPKVQVLSNLSSRHSQT